MPHPLDTCELCNVPTNTLGFTATATYISRGVKGLGIGISTSSQLEANERARENAVRAALNNQSFFGASLL